MDGTIDLAVTESLVRALADIYTILQSIETSYKMVSEIGTCLSEKTAYQGEAFKDLQDFIALYMHHLQCLSEFYATSYKRAIELINKFIALDQAYAATQKVEEVK